MVKLYQCYCRASHTGAAPRVVVVVGCWLLVVGCGCGCGCCCCWLLIVGCWLLVVGCWLLVVGCWLLVVGCGCCCCCWSLSLLLQLLQLLLLLLLLLLLPLQLFSQSRSGQKSSNRCCFHNSGLVGAMGLQGFTVSSITHRALRQLVFSPKSALVWRKPAWVGRGVAPRFAGPMGWIGRPLTWKKGEFSISCMFRGCCRC